MLIFAARYTLIFWFSFISSSNSGIVFMRYMERIDKGIYAIAACTLQCMQREQLEQFAQGQAQSQPEREPQPPLQTTQDAPGQDRGTLLQYCYSTCTAAHGSPGDVPNQLARIQESLIMTLVCRDDRSLTFRIDLFDGAPLAANTKGNSTIDNESAEPEADAHIDTVYVIKRHVVDGTDSYFVYMTDEKFFTLPDLKDNVEHNISAVAVHADQTYSVIAKEESFRTLRRGFTPGNVRDIQVKGFFADAASEMHLKAKIVWKPSSDMTCHYNIIFYSPHSVDYELTPIRNPRQLYSYTLENLTFSSEYEVGIRAKNPNNISKESMLIWKKVVTPSCEEWYNYNFNICAPPEPEELTVEQIYLAKNELSLNISWLQPKYYPDYYTLRILDLVPNGASYAYNVSKESTSVFIEKIVLRSMFEVHLTAYTRGGNKTAQRSDVAKMYALPDKSHIVKLVSVIFAPIFCIVITSLTAFIICHRRAKLKRYEERCKYFEDLEKKAPIDPKTPFDMPPKDLTHLRIAASEHPTQIQLDADEKGFLNDEMEIDRNDVKLYEVLGEGAFGLVRRGIYQTDTLGPREVAVKMLKDQPSGDDIKAFRREIEVMKSVDKHPNIVGIIGHCTKRYNEMMLLTEYCSLGNLLDFLRNEWKYLHELSLKRNVVLGPPVLPVRRHINGRLQKGEDGHQRPVALTVSRDQQLNRNAGDELYSSNGTATTAHNNTNSSVFNFDSKLLHKIKSKYKYFQASPTHTAKRSQNCPNSDDNHIEELFEQSSTILTPPLTPEKHAVGTTAAAGHRVDASVKAAVNKSYGYDEVCTNACKCHVNVIIRDIGGGAADAADAADEADGVAESEQLERKPSKRTQSSAAEKERHRRMPSSTIEVKNCECRQQLLLAKNNKKNAAVAAAVAEKRPASLTVENKSYFCETKWQSTHGTVGIDTGRIKSASYDHKLSTGAAPAPAAAVAAEERRRRSKSSAKKSPSSSDALRASVRRVPLTAGDLLDIAKQVAIGMECLAKNKVVHRDLAARNVLVAHDRTIKIADFGLSRDIYQENIYKKRGNGKLPIKWLALESMTHQVYTTQSDVWSYGILLYEIITLGGTPYPSIPTNRLLHLLKTGYRMERPRNCGQNYYNLMYSCWNVNPAERPNFTEIIQILDNLLEGIHQQPQHHTNQLQQQAELMACALPTLCIREEEPDKLQRTSNSEQRTSEDSYMKPLGGK